MAALAAALVLCCAGSGSAATVAPRTAVLGADDVAGLSVGSTSAAPWVLLAGGRTTAGSHASSSVLRSSGAPKLLIVSRALVARDSAHASAFKRALGAAGKAAADRADVRALGVKAGALRDARRIVWREGPVVGELVAVGAAKGDALIARLQAIVRSRVRRAVAQSAWDALQARVAARGGHPDAATAQQAFALAVTVLPGVRLPKGPRGSIPEGTLATSWVLANYGRLTPAVRQAVDRVMRRAFGLSGSAPPRRTPTSSSRATPRPGRSKSTWRAVTCAWGRPASTPNRRATASTAWAAAPRRSTLPSPSAVAKRGRR